MTRSAFETHSPFEVFAGCMVLAAVLLLGMWIGRSVEHEVHATALVPAPRCEPRDAGPPIVFVCSGARLVRIGEAEAFSVAPNTEWTWPGAPEPCFTRNGRCIR